MNKFEMINNINAKAKNNRNGLQSLSYTLAYDSASSKGEGNIDYSRTGTFITEMPGHLMAYRIKPTSEANIFRLYIGNIYPTQFEVDKFSSSGFKLHDAQKDREFAFAEDNYDNLTDDELDLLAEKIEVYCNIDAKTADFLKTRKKGQRILISGRYDFTRPEYSIIKPEDNEGSGRRRRKTSSASSGNKYWDKISLNLLNPYFVQPNEVDVKFGKTVKFLDISKTVKLAAFDLEAQKIAAKYGTKVKFTNLNQEILNFDLTTVPAGKDSNAEENILLFKKLLFATANKYNIKLQGSVVDSTLQVSYFIPKATVDEAGKTIDKHEQFLQAIKALKTSYRVVESNELVALFANGMKYVSKNNFNNLFYKEENVQGLSFNLEAIQDLATFKKQFINVAATHSTKVKFAEDDANLQVVFIKNAKTADLINEIKTLNVEFAEVGFNDLIAELQVEDKRISNIEFSSDIVLNLTDYIKLLKPVEGFNVVIPRNTNEGIILSLSAAKNRNKFVKKHEHDNKVFYSEYFGKVSIPRQIVVDDNFITWDEEISVNGSGPDAVPFKKQSAAQKKAKDASNGTDENGLADMQPTHVSAIQYKFAPDDEKCFYETNGVRRYTIKGKKFRVPIFYKF